MDCHFQHEDLHHFIPVSLGEFAGEACAADDAYAQKRVRHEMCYELLSDASALHEWPAPAKRARQDGWREHAWKLGDSLDKHALLPINVAFSTPVAPLFCPPRPRANAMHVHEESGVATDGVVPPLCNTSHQEVTSLFVRFAQLASDSGVAPLCLPSPDEFPTTAQMQTIVRAIIAT